MFPSGHSRNNVANLKDISNYKNSLLGRLALSDTELTQKLAQFNNIESLTNADLQNLKQVTCSWSSFLPMPLKVDHFQFVHDAHSLQDLPLKV